jgi:hypothetical protein
MEDFLDLLVARKLYHRLEVCSEEQLAGSGREWISRFKQNRIFCHVKMISLGSILSSITQWFVRIHGVRSLPTTMFSTQTAS